MLALKRLTLARSTLDRAAELRAQPDELERLWHLPETKILHVHQNHIACVGDELQFGEPGDGERYFLGMEEGIAYFAVHDEDSERNWRTLRDVGHLLSDRDVGLATHAIALANWHVTHTHCPRCGASTVVVQGGSVRRCERDESEHYPRTDPAVIVLVRDQSDRILLGRQKVWPAKRYSTFAGFVEPGESFESAVKREVAEEAGVKVREIEYLGSQPWPFPASIMVAFVATAENPEDARPDGDEIESILWFSRPELVSAIDAGEILLPPGISIARRMIEAWYGEPLSGGQAWR